MDPEETHGHRKRHGSRLFGEPIWAPVSDILALRSILSSCQNLMLVVATQPRLPSVSSVLATSAQLTPRYLAICHQGLEPTELRAGKAPAKAHAIPPEKYVYIVRACKLVFSSPIFLCACNRFCSNSNLGMAHGGAQRMGVFFGRPFFIQCRYWEELRSLYEVAKLQPSTG